MAGRLDWAAARTDRPCWLRCDQQHTLLVPRKALPAADASGMAREARQVTVRRVGPSLCSAAGLSMWPVLACLARLPSQLGAVHQRPAVSLPAWSVPGPVLQSPRCVRQIIQLWPLAYHSGVTVTQGLGQARRGVRLQGAGCTAPSGIAWAACTARAAASRPTSARGSGQQAVPFTSSARSGACASLPPATKMTVFLV